MPTREEAQKQLVAKAWKDPNFKQSLIKDPKAAIAKEFGVHIPADISVKVLEETPNSVYLVLPASPSGIEKGELSDLELEAIAGGKTDPPPPTCCPGTSLSTLTPKVKCATTEPTPTP